MSDFNYMFYDDETCGAAGIICQIGYVITDAMGNILRTFQTLINPHHSFDWYVVKNVHGIDEDAVANAPEFMDVWNTEIKPYLGNCVLIAHGAKSADLHHIKKSFAHAGCSAELPQIRYIDTIDVARTLPIQKYGLAVLADRYGIIEENHHDALDDADVLRQVFFKMIEETGTPEPSFWPIPKFNHTKQLKLFDDVPAVPWPTNNTELFDNISTLGQWATNDQVLAAKNVVLGGCPVSLTKADARQRVEAHGFSTQNLISKNTDLVIINENMNPKMFMYIAKMRVPVVTYDDFVSIISQ